MDRSVGTQSTPAGLTGPVAQRQAWRDLPPLDETIAPPPLVAPNSRFSAGLAVNNPPPPALAPLGHQRSSDGPAGLTMGLARPLIQTSRATTAAPAAARQSGFSLRRIIQRRAADEAMLPGGPVWPTDTEPAGAAGPADSAPASQTPSVPALPTVAPRRLSSVAPAAAVQRAALTTAPASPVPLAIQKSASGGARAQQSSAARPSPTRPVSPFRALFHPETTGPVPPPVEFGSTPPPSRPTASQPPVQRLTLGQSRRLGLGPPLGSPARGSPAGSTAGGTAAGGADTGGSSLPLAQPTAQRSADTGTTTSSPAGAADSAAGTAAAPADAAASTSTAAKPAAPQPSVARQSSSAPASSVPAVARRSGVPTAAPLTGHEPLIQRPPTAGGSGGAGDSGGARGSIPAGPSHLGLGEPLNLAGRPVARGEADAAEAAGSSPTASLPPVQRSAAPAAGPGTSASGPHARGAGQPHLPDAPLLGTPLGTAIGPDAGLASSIHPAAGATAHSSGDDAGLRIQRRSRNDASDSDAPTVQLEAAASPSAPSTGAGTGGTSTGTITDASPLTLAVPARPAAPDAKAAVSATTVGSINPSVTEGGHPTSTPAAARPSSAAAQRAAAAAAGSPVSVRQPDRPGVSGLVGSRPLAQARVQRSAAGAPVRVWRDEAAGQAAGRLNAHAFTQGGDIFMPAQHGPLDRGAGQALLAHELVHVQQQRALGPNLPSEDGPAGQVLELQARRPERGGGGMRTSAANGAGAALPLASSRTIARAAAAEAATEAVAAASVQRAAAETAPDDASVQRVVMGGHRVPPLPATPTEGPAETASPASAIPDDPAQLDELAGKLWSHLRTRLRRELLADRERAGMLTDLR